MKKIIHANDIHFSQGVQPALFELVVDIPNDDVVHAFLEVVEGVKLSQYLPPVFSTNPHSHDRVMLLRTALFAFSQGIRSTRDIAEKCRTDVRFLFLSNCEHPSHQAFERMFQLLEKSIDDIFFEISSKIAVDLMDEDLNIQYVDGTKIEANANKNSFVYKKRILHTQEKMFVNIQNEIHNLNQDFGWNFHVQNNCSCRDLFQICRYLMEVMVQEGIEIKYGIGKRKSDFQRYYDKFLTFALRKMDYEYWLNEIGERRSCSKIDHDATMMNTKYDYYNQTGVTRACYNPQIAGSGGIIVNADIFQTPGDTTTWAPFMDRFYDHYGYYPKTPVADAGYGGYDNYMFNLKHGIDLVQKYNYYGKTLDPKFRKKIYNQFNWKQNEEGFKICPAGKVFDCYEEDRFSRTSGGNLRIQQIWKEKDQCEGCPMRSECTKARNGRIVAFDPVLAEFQRTVDQNLGGEEGKERRRQRSIQVEGAFGVIKQDFKFTRFSRRGMSGVKMEFLLVCLGYNLKKYYIYWLKQRRNQPVDGKYN